MRDIRIRHNCKERVRSPASRIPTPFLQSFLSVAVWVGCLLVCGSAQAGVYNTTERPLVPLPTSLKEIRFLLGEYRAIDQRAANPLQPNGAPDSFRAEYVRQAAQLA